MEQKKTGKEPLLWGICAVAIYFGFTRVLALFTKMLGMKVQEYFLVAIALLAGLLLFVFLPLKYLADRVCRKSHKEYSQLKRVIFILCFAGGFILRLYCMEMLPAFFYSSAYPAGSASEWFLAEDTSVYDTAALLIGRSLAPQGFLVKDLYLWLLTLVFSFTGASQAGCMWLNLFLQMGALCLICLSLRKLVGEVPAVIAGALIFLYPTIAKLVCESSEENLLLFLLAFMFTLCAAEYRKLMEHADKTMYESAFCLCIWGLISGIFLAVSLELVSVSILFAGLILGNDKICEKRKKAQVYVSFMLIGFVFLFGLFYLSFGKEADAGLIISDWWKVISSTGSYANADKRNFLEIAAALPLYLAAFLVLLGGYGSFSYEEAKYFGIPVSVSVLFAYSRTYRPGDQIVLFIYLSILAGMGIYGTLRPVKREKDMKETETVQDNLEKETESVQEALPKEAKLAEDVAKQEEDSVTPAGVYLKNPLPVPKRHVKKVMDYDFEPAEDMLHFDVEISADDDFDLK